MSRRVKTGVTRIERAKPGSTWAKWVCTCGRSSRMHGFSGNAEAAGRHHARATGCKFDEWSTGAGRVGRSGAGSGR